MIRIFSDSTCDLSKELIERYDITILPLHILLGEVGARLDKSCNANGSQLYSDHHSVHKAESSLLTLGQAANDEQHSRKNAPPSHGS